MNNSPKMNKNKYEFTLDTYEKNDSHMGLAIKVNPRQRVLELGCSSGHLSKFLKEELACHVVGVDIDSNAIQLAKPFCNQVIVADLDSDAWLTEIENQQFDVILCADVLEHLKDPVHLLAQLKPFLHHESRILASVPNIAHASIRLELMQGHFDYESLGLLDETHLHFYTRDGLIKMLMQAGYICYDISYSIHDLADEAINQHLKNIGIQASDKTRQILHEPDAIAYQFIIEARPAKAELVKNLPRSLSPKPLVSSGVFYSEKQQKIVNLEQQIIELNSLNKESVTQLNNERIHIKNHLANVTQYENKAKQLEQQLVNEQIHIKNHQTNLNKSQEKIKTLEHQLEGEKIHNENHLLAIESWENTTKTLDDHLFELTKNIGVEQEKSNKSTDHALVLEQRIVHLQALNETLTYENQHLESVLQNVHSKISYKIIRRIKDSVKNWASLFKQSSSLEHTNKASIAEIQSQPLIDVNDYGAWLQQYDVFSEQKSSTLNLEIASWKQLPKIAILMPVYNPDESCLINAIESVLQQIYTNFELCIADDASTKSHVAEILKKYELKDNRIKVIYRKQNGHISAASNSALDLVDAEYLALMDHDDLLTPDALFWVAKTIHHQPDVQLIYSDEDKMDLQGNRYAPYFKPDWNPELFLSHNFICHLGVYKTEKVKNLGGFDSDFNGAQDYDLALRYVETINSDQIAHIPRILYHWRAVEGSTANGVHEKPYAEAVIQKTVACALQRKERAAEVKAHGRLPGALRVRYLLPEKLPLVSIVIPTRNGFDLLHRCIESILDNTHYANYEIMIIDNGSDELVALRYLQRLQENSRITVIRDDSPFNYAALNNKAVAMAKGEIIAFLNNDLEVINPDWLDEMVGHVVHPEVGAVGAKLYYPDDTIQHAGVIVGLGGGRGSFA